MSHLAGCAEQTCNVLKVLEEGAKRLASIPQHERADDGVWGCETLARSVETMLADNNNDKKMRAKKKVWGGNEAA
jgi:hypothetical protein